jgi:hypothetical protein
MNEHESSKTGFFRPEGNSLRKYFLDPLFFLHHVPCCYQVLTFSMITITQTTKQTVTAIFAMWRRAVVAAVIAPRTTCVLAVASHRNNRDAEKGSGI